MQLRSFFSERIKTDINFVKSFSNNFPELKGLKNLKPVYLIDLVIR